MGDAEQLKGPRAGEPEANQVQPQEPTEGADVVSVRRPASTPPSQGAVRRSSLRPAPADYRPSVRDPSTMRPMMVVRAGDVEPTDAHVPPVSGRSEHETQKPPSSASASFTASRAARVPPTDEQREVAIPSPPQVPADLAASAGSTDFEPNKLPLGVRQTDEPAAVVATPGARQGSAARDLGGVELRAKALARDAVAVPTPEAARLPRWRFVAVAIIGVAVVGAVLTLRARKQASVTRAAEAVARQAPSLKTPAPVALNQLAPAGEPSGSRETTLTQSAAMQSEPQPLATSATEVAAAGSDTTRVRLELRPTDAKVLVRGREVPGPPYEFEVAKGQKIAVEVVRFGFVTAKVVIDDKKPVVSFGMLRASYRR